MGKKRAVGSQRPGRNWVAETGPTDYAALWQAKAKEPEDYPVIEREFAGLPCKVRRMPIRAWIRAGHMPAFLATEYARALDGNPAAVEEDEYTPEQREAYLQFRRVAVCETVVEPRIVLGREPQAGEVGYEWALLNFPEAIDALQAWVLRGCPDIPVQVKGGALTTDELSKFRDGEVVPPDGEAVGEVWWKTQPTSRTVR